MIEMNITIATASPDYSYDSFLVPGYHYCAYIDNDSQFSYVARFRTQDEANELFKDFLTLALSPDAVREFVPDGLTDFSVNELRKCAFEILDWARIYNGNTATIKTWGEEQ